MLCMAFLRELCVIMEARIASGRVFPKSAPCRGVAFGIDSCFWVEGMFLALGSCRFVRTSGTFPKSRLLPALKKVRSLGRLVLLAKVLCPIKHKEGSPNTHQ